LTTQYNMSNILYPYGLSTFPSIFEPKNYTTHLLTHQHIFTIHFLHIFYLSGPSLIFKGTASACTFAVIFICVWPLLQLSSHVQFKIVHAYEHFSFPSHNTYIHANSFWSSKLILDQYLFNIFGLLVIITIQAY